MRNFLIIAVACLLAFSSAALAQSLTNLTPYDTFEFQLDPGSPGPNTDVKASIITYSFNLDASLITWTLNGKIIEQGRGKKSINFKTGDIGSKTSLSVFVITEQKKQIQKQLAFKIGDVDLLVQPLTYVPAFCKGSPQAVIDAPVKITAIPFGMGLSKDLIFEWSRNYEKAADASGTGKNSYTFTYSLFNPEETITVKVSDIQGNFNIERATTVKSAQPEIIFYEENPLKGPLFAKSLAAEVSLQQPEFTLRAEPYYFSKNMLGALNYSWSMNNKAIEPLGPPNMLGLTTPEETNGQSTIYLEVRNQQSFSQKATASLIINF